MAPNARLAISRLHTQPLQGKNLFSFTFAACGPQSQKSGFSTEARWAFWRQAERAEIQGAGAARGCAAFIIHKILRNTRNLWDASFSGRNCAPAHARKAKNNILYTGYTGRSGYNPGQAGAGPTLFQGAGRREQKQQAVP